MQLHQKDNVTDRNAVRDDADKVRGLADNLGVWFSASPNELVRWLKELDGCDVTKPLLVETKVGVVVNRLAKRHKDDEVRTLGQHLVRKWKQNMNIMAAHMTNCQTSSAASSNALPECVNQASTNSVSLDAQIMSVNPQDIGVHALEATGSSQARTQTSEGQRMADVASEVPSEKSAIKRTAEFLSRAEENAMTDNKKVSQAKIHGELENAGVDKSDQEENKQRRLDPKQVLDIPFVDKAADSQLPSENSVKQRRAEFPPASRSEENEKTPNDKVSQVKRPREFENTGVDKDDQEENKRRRSATTQLLESPFLDKDADSHSMHWWRWMCGCRQRRPANVQL
eukprot:gnl/MRDRNA2_/MRDRNA2_142585_c0_seq1.p1 gnl/MRDRNA2_/MRDRNA2_142585_c0~~gnl/MRDRNA2_/MRDRNA2_142585_c0_seq1.p1  ORF type:complete len:341 (+),score=58.81 gnl/MRDRNA2_/MRDRNA2_142585_c0_seq1:38-1060(+)